MAFLIVEKGYKEDIGKMVKPLLPYADVLMPTRGGLRQYIPPETDIPICLRVSGGTSILNESNLLHEGIAVDTHVMRLSKRLGFTKEKNRNTVERDLMDLFPKDQWFALTNLLIAHGRNICVARYPKCGECVVNQLCPSAFTFE